MSEEQITLDTLNRLPAGCIGLVHTEYDILSWTIRLLTKSWTNHALIYLGSGKHEVIEALAEGVVLHPIDLRFNKKNRIKFYVKQDLTVSQLQKIKDYAYSRVDRRYDFKGLFSFVGRWIIGRFGFNPSLRGKETKDFCSDLVVDSYDAASLKISFKGSEETTPDDLEKYFLSDTGNMQGWILAFKWNC